MADAKVYFTAGLPTGAGPLPTAPTISVAAGTGQVVVTIDGDADVTNYVLYKSGADSIWTAGGNRSGDGDVTITNLDNNTPYTITCYSVSVNGLSSTPASAVTVILGQ